MSKTALLTCCVLVAALDAVGCRPAIQEVGANVKTSMQHTFDTEARFKRVNPKVAKIVLVRDHDNSYQGIATVISSGQPHDVSITVVADGENLIWKAEPGALLALSLPDLQNSQISSADSPNLAPNIESDAQSEISSFEDRAMSIVKSDYKFKAEQPEKVRQGQWYSSRTGKPGGQFIDVVVDYVVPLQGVGGRWTVSFPRARPSVYSISIDERAKQLFVEVPNDPPASN